MSRLKVAPMKLRVSSYSYAAYVNAGGASYEQLCDLARETGFEGIEFIDLDSPIFGCGGIRSPWLSACAPAVSQLGWNGLYCGS